MSTSPQNWIGWRKPIWLTLTFWAFTFVVFQAPALKTGRLTGWETAGYVVIVASGAIISMMLLTLVWRTRGLEARRRIMTLAAAAIAAAIVHSILDHEIFVITAGLFKAPNRMPPLLDGFVFNILIYIWIYGLYVTAAELIITSRQMREQERRLAAATAAAQEAQLTALRFQINPHFLFNALNAVTALIGAGRNVEAEAVVIRLSEFFRASLMTAPGDLVSLEEELDVTGSYLDIEAARFGDRLRVEIDFPDELRSVMVPHFILQPLAENAIKHGVARAKQPVTVTVHAWAAGEVLTLAVTDNAGLLQAQDAANAGGIGLRNVSARLHALFAERAALHTGVREGRFVAEILMPLQPAQRGREAA